MDMELISLSDPYALGDEEQALADALIAQLEAEVADDPPGVLRASALLDEQRFPGFSAWMGLRRSALALHTLYRGSVAERFAWGLEDDVFTRPRFDGWSAIAVLERELGIDRAAEVRSRHQAFLAAPYHPLSRLLITGSLDGRAIRARAALAACLIEGRLGTRTTPVRLASVACGTAGPIAETARSLHECGVPVTGLTLLDRDPMALAAGADIARDALHGLEPQLLLVDLIANRRVVELKPCCAAGWDVVDILGLFEYLPDSFATELIRNAVAACRPGGIVVVANMLDERPQQVFFSGVLQWPRLYQRSPAELLALLERAGVSPAQVTLCGSRDAPVYAVAGIHV